MWLRVIAAILALGPGLITLLRPTPMFFEPALASPDEHIELVSRD